MEKGSEPANSDPLIFPRKYGAGTRNRTTDLLITNQLLYQLSYAGFGLEFVEGRGLFPFRGPLTRLLRTIVDR